MRSHIGLLIVALVSVSSEVAAQTPLGTAFTYQGRLQNAGSPAGGLHDLRFRLYDAAAGGGQIGATLCVNDVSVTDGLFNASLDFGAQFAGQERFLEVEVRADTGLNCADPAQLIVLSPRQALTAAPNALFALNASTATTAMTSTDLTLPFAGSAGAAGNVLDITNSGAGGGVRGVVASPSGLTNPTSSYNAGLWGDTNAGDGVHGTTSGPGSIGVLGYSTGDGGAGVYAQADSVNGMGVFSLVPAVAGTTYGGYFQSNSVSGTGVFGVATAASGTTYGVYGQSASPGGRGVYGLASGNFGTYGVYGQSTSANGYGVYGKASALTGINYGGWFQSDSTSGYAVYGRANGSSGTIYGVYGYASVSADGYAVFALGDMGTNGLKPFRIDHPDDPANKYLLHYAAESPEVINFYSETVTLDDRGEAVVELPQYFAKINTRPRYQLTAVGAPMPMLHVAEKISTEALATGATMGPGEAAPLCSFRIAGGIPGGEVSWEVKAQRNDRWVQERGAPVEVDKQGVEKGTYQSPELYGQPPEVGMNYDAARERSPRDVGSDKKD